MLNRYDVLSDPKRRQYENFGDPTLADAILDRIAHNAYKITLQGESMRKKLNKD
jgi:DNA replication protein DnaC